MSLLIISFALTVGISFVCSILEAILLSLPHSYALNLAQTSRAGRYLEQFKDNIGRPLSAILTLNTIANTAGATSVGAEAVKVFSDSVFSDSVVFISSATLTISILVFSEIIPKTIGTVYCKALSVPAAYLIKFFVIISYPLVLIFEYITNHIQGDEEPVKVSREEMLTVAQMGASEGTLNKREALLIENILKLVDVQVEDVMTPRAVIKAYQRDMTIGEIVNQPKMIRFARVPVFTKNLDDIDGMVLRYDILRNHAKGKVGLAVSSLASPVHIVPEGMSVGAVMEEFIKRNEQLFIVVDEHGGTAGLISLEDAVETLLGVEIVDELDTVADMRKLARERFARRQRNQDF